MFYWGFSHTASSSTWHHTISVFWNPFALSPTNLPTLSLLPALASSLHWTKGLSSHWCPTRRSFPTYAAGDMSCSRCTLWFCSLVSESSENWESWWDKGAGLRVMAPIREERQIESRHNHLAFATFWLPEMSYYGTAPFAPIKIHTWFSGMIFNVRAKYFSNWRTFSFMHLCTP